MNIKILIQLLKRECHKIIFNKDIRLMCFIAPFLYSILLSSVYVTPSLHELKLAAIDQDNSKLSHEFLRKLDATENIDLALRLENEDFKEVDSLIVSDQIEGFILIPHNFSNKIKKSGYAGSSKVFASVNASNFMIANPILTSINELSLNFSNQLFIDNLQKKGISRKRAEGVATPILLKENIEYNFSLHYQTFIIPGLLLAILQQIILVAIGFSMVNEHESSEWKELLQITRNRIWPIMFAKTFPYIILNFIIGLIFLYVVSPCVNIYPQSSFITISIQLLFFVITTSFLALFISTWFNSTITLMIALMFFSIPAFLLSGLSWPQMALSLPSKIAAYLLPSTFFLKDFRLFILSNLDFAYCTRLLLWLSGFTLINITGTFITLKIKNRAK